jgi:integrase
MLQSYIVEVRRKGVSPRGDHMFLWVASNGGLPLSIASLNKVWLTLRKRVPQLPKDISSHVLRHTWNDHFSAALDRNRTVPPTLVEENNEKKVRSYLMGWNENSGTAATYTRRHIQKKAAEASLKCRAKSCTRVVKSKSLLSQSQRVRQSQSLAGHLQIIRRDVNSGELDTPKLFL